jgi:peptidyl-prolyl cis-trans isomerase A (cyclophilin A)
MDTTVKASIRHGFPLAIGCTFIAISFGLLSACGGGEAPKKAAPKQLSERAPDVYRVKFETSRGDFVIEVDRALAPRGADRFYNLIEEGFYNGSRFHRVVRNFIVQWGVNADPAVQRLWTNLRIQDDPVKGSNKKGTVCFAKLGPASRTTQVFINLRDNSKALDKEGFAPFGKVVEGMEVVESLYSSYGEVAPRGNGPDPVQLEIQGNKYIESKFPRLDYIKRATLV